MARPDWRKVVTDPKEVALFRALEHPDFTWRTLPALVRESEMPEADVLASLWRRQDFVIEGRTRPGEPVWTLRSRYWQEAGLPQILHMISHTSPSSR